MNDLIALFDHNALLVALGELIATAREIGDAALEHNLLEEMNDAIADVRHLEACLKLDMA